MFKKTFWRSEGERRSEKEPNKRNRGREHCNGRRGTTGTREGFQRCEMKGGEEHSGGDEEGGSGRQIIARDIFMYCVVRFHRLSAIWTGHPKLAVS